MRKTMALALIAAIALIGCSIGAFAADPVNGIAQRIENQQRRIEAGIAKGQLTRQEVDTVQDNLNWIRETFARMTRDRILTGAEIRKLNGMLDQNSRMIAKETRDFQRVYPGVAHDDFDARIRSQQQRIDAGIAQRQLTRQEADTVQDNLNWIRDTFARMKRDGRLTAREQNRLDEMLEHNSQLIYKTRHDFDRFRDNRGNRDFFK